MGKGACLAVGTRALGPVSWEGTVTQKGGNGTRLSSKPRTSPGRLSLSSLQANTVPRLPAPGERSAAPEINLQRPTEESRLSRGVGSPGLLPRVPITDSDRIPSQLESLTGHAELIPREAGRPRRPFRVAHLSWQDLPLLQVLRAKPDCRLLLLASGSPQRVPSGVARPA